MKARKTVVHDIYAWPSFAVCRNFLFEIIRYFLSTTVAGRCQNFVQQSVWKKSQCHFASHPFQNYGNSLLWQNSNAQPATSQPIWQLDLDFVQIEKSRKNSFNFGREKYDYLLVSKKLTFESILFWLRIKSSQHQNFIYLNWFVKSFCSSEVLSADYSLTC